MRPSLPHALLRAEGTKAERMNITASIETIPDDDTGRGDRQADELPVEAESYEAGVAALRARVPEGWWIMNLRHTEY